MGYDVSRCSVDLNIPTDHNAFGKFRRVRSKEYVSDRVRRNVFSFSTPG
jgi:hypothetical protein